MQLQYNYDTTAVHLRKNDKGELRYNYDTTTIQLRYTNKIVQQQFWSLILIPYPDPWSWSLVLIPDPWSWFLTKQLRGNYDTTTIQLLYSRDTPTILSGKLAGKLIKTLQIWAHNYFWVVRIFFYQQLLECNLNRSTIWRPQIFLGN